MSSSERRRAAWHWPLLVALMTAAAPSAQAQFYDPKFCANGTYYPLGIGLDYESYCRGYRGEASCMSTADQDACLQGQRAGMWERQARDTQKAQERQRIEDERERRALLATPPLAAGANPLLGHWRRVAAGSPARGLIESLTASLTEIVCTQVQGTGSSFELRADALVHGKQPVSPMQYRAGPNGLVYAFGEREPLRQLAFRLQGRDRMTLANCAFERVGAVAASTIAGTTAARAPAAPGMQTAARPDAAARPPPEVCRRTFVDKLGAASVDEVRQAAQARFKETLTGGVPDTANVRLDARGSACDDPRLNATLYDFDASGVLRAVTYVWARPAGPAPAPIFNERVAALSRLHALPQPQSPGRLQADISLGRLILQDLPERNLLLEAYAARK